ncbi:MAG: CDP-alcohol phosphatidyltransferase family protein [Simkania sp.]|nr:CDP-alcohol phosphatidyltransferase family protein [Simkania sp.]
MLSLSNALSLLRAPLALLFLVEKPYLRLVAILLAMLTDSIDGYLARRSRSVTQFGAILDPAMDKFFVFFALGVLVMEGQLLPWQACAMISRDFFLCFFAIYLAIAGKWQDYECRSIRWGKITTALQFFVLIGLSLDTMFSPYVYIVFIISGCLAFIELCLLKKIRKPSLDQA